MAVKVREWKGAWWVFVDHRGRRKAKRVGVGARAKRAADTAAEQIQAKLTLGDLSVLAERPAAPPMLAAYAERWLVSVRGRLKQGTAERYTYVIHHDWVPTLGTQAVSAITRESIKRALAGWLAAGTRSKTVQLRLSVLVACLASAVEDGLLAANPAAKLGKWAKRSSETVQPVEIFTRAELRAILGAAERERPEWATCVLLLARTGLRIGEALVLQWDDLDLSGRAVTVRRTWAGCVARQMNTPKGNRERRVDVSQQLAKALVTHQDRLQVDALTRGTEFGPWVFPGSNGEPVIKQVFSGRIWGPVLKAAGVRYRNPHVLRHTFASLLLAQGESLAYVKDQLGHASIRLTVDLYGHLVPGGNRAAVDKLDDVELAHGSGGRPGRPRLRGLGNTPGALAFRPPSATPAQPNQAFRRLAGISTRNARRTPS
jgi:integrase